MVSTSNPTTPETYVQELALRIPTARKRFLWVLKGFQHFAAERATGKSVSEDIVRLWLNDRAKIWPFAKLAERARVVDCFLNWRVQQDPLASNPFADLRKGYGQRRVAPVVRALLSPDSRAALEALRPAPRFGSFLGPVMREHVALMQAVGYRYGTQEGRLLRLDRFLQGRPDLSGKAVTVLIREWAKTRSGPQQALECQLTGRTLSRALSRIDPTVEKMPWDKRIRQEALRRHRRPYPFTETEIRCLLETALSLPSRQSRLRPQTAHMMLVLAYCAGLRIGEIVRLDMGDFDADDHTIEIRGTKFFKSRRLPLSKSVVVALQAYLKARKEADAPTNHDNPMFWHRSPEGRYSRSMASDLLVRVLQRAGLKPASGRVGPRVHDLRHAFVVNRMLTWYREGINPQSRLPYLATYLGHKDINSTLIYLTITQELLQHAGERFRVRGVQVLQTSTGGKA
jgi:integrase/recombinase XerD